MSAVRPHPALAGRRPAQPDDVASVVGRSIPSPRPRGPHTPPLAGVTVTGTAIGHAGAVALHHLGALGARHRPGPHTTQDDTREHLTLAPQDGLPPLVCEIRPFPDAPEPGPEPERLPLPLPLPQPRPRPRLGETAFQAMAGLMAVNGRQWHEPRRIPLDYVATCAGVLAVQGVLAAMIARLRGAPLGRVATAHSSAALLSVSQYLAAATAVEGPDPEASRARPDTIGTDPDTIGTDLSTIGTGPGTIGTGPPFLSRDGVWFELETLDSGPWRDFWADLGLRCREVSLGWQSFVHRYAAAVAPLPPLLHRTLGSLDFTDIAAAGARTGLSVARVRTTAERYADEGPFPEPWILRPLGRGRSVPDPPDVRPTAEQPLRGMTVVEATRRVQGPLAGHVLQMLGARVVRVEPPGGDPQRGTEPVVGDCSARFLALNEAKSVVEADLKTVEGRQTVRALALEADVFLHNWAPGKAEVFGLDAETLCSANPDLVYAHASGWGPSSTPDLLPGTDFMVQARSGLAWDMAEGDNKPRPTLMTVLDVLGGLVSAEGVLAGLLARERGGGPQRVDTSLLSAATILQHRPSGPGSSTPTAHAAWEGPYRTATGYIALSLPSANGPELLGEALNLPVALTEPSLRRAVAARLRSRPARSWIEALGRDGIEAVPVHEELSAVADEPKFRADIRPGACASVSPPWRFQS